MQGCVVKNRQYIFMAVILALSHFFKIIHHSLAQSAIKLIVLLCLPPELWDDRHMLITPGKKDSFNGIDQTLIGKDWTCLMTQLLPLSWRKKMN